MRRRFAGDALGGTSSVPADTLAAATEALKQAQASLKGSRGGRLGPGTQEERDQGAKAVPALPSASTTAAPAATAPSVNIAGLRSALGIDQLMSALQGVGGYGAQQEMPQFEMPQFEMPEFEMPQFEMPDWESLLSQYMPKQEDTQDTGAETPTAGVSKAKGTKIKVGGKTYDLSTRGGAGLGANDIKFLQKKGWTQGQIKKLSAQALSAGQRVAPSAQKLIDRLKPKTAQTRTPARTPARTQARSISASARQAVARTAPKPTRQAPRPTRNVSRTAKRR